MPRVKCNKLFQYKNDKGFCSYKGTVSFESNGNYDHFEKNFHYYFNKVWNALKNTNMIFYHDLTDELRLGIYYVMEVFNLQYADFKSSSFICLVETGNSKGLTYSDIIKLPMNMEKLAELYADFNNGKFPNSYLNYLDEKNKNEVEKDEHLAKVYPKPEYGFLSPDGKFYPGDWGTHTAEAYKIIARFKWNEEHLKSKWHNPRDFLCYEKNYLLLDDPYNNESIYNIQISGRLERMTEKQATFLFDYFNKYGDPERALQIWKDFSGVMMEA